MDKKKGVFYRINKLFLPYKIRIFFALLALAVTTGSILLYGSVAKNFIDDSVGASKGEVEAGAFLFAFLAITVALAISGFFRSYLINDVALKIANDLRKKVFAKAICLPVQYFDNNGYSDIVSRINHDISEIFNIFTKNITFFLRNLILSVAGVALLSLINIKLFAIMLFSVLASLLPIFMLAKSLKSRFSKVKDSASKLNSFVEESLLCVKIIKSFNGEEKSTIDYENSAESMFVIERYKSILQSVTISIAIFFAFSAIALVLYFGALDVFSGNMSVGIFSEFVFYAVILSIALVGMAQSLSQILSVRTSAERIFELLDKEVEGVNTANSIDTNCSQKDNKAIEFKNVIFAYPCKKGQCILNDVSFNIARGQKVAIEGGSGSGKSTIFSLLLRFYDLDSGSVTVNGKSICQYNLRSLRDVFSYSMQESFVFSGTILDNITYPNSDFNSDTICKIISECDGFDFVRKLPDGVDSDIGNIGSKLSGGQKQRIAILRSVLSKAEILIFDESTCALDVKNEDLMIDLIDKYAKEKTVIFVSHKINKKLHLDQVIKLT